ncbi:MAG: enoyl-CoA hydratase-related protein [Candidatus Binatia bacterium]
MGTAEVVLYESKDGVATLTLNRPERMNAITPEMEIRYFDLLERAGRDPDVRVVVVTGAGRGFCAGFDMEALRGLGEGERAATSGKPQTFPLTIPKPILAAINGSCAGLGLVWALMADLRFAAAATKFTTAFVRRGLIAEHGSSWVLPRLVGHSRALDLLLSGRVFLSEEAFEMGLVNRVVPAESLLQQTLEYARDLAVNCSPASMAAMKWQIYRHWDLDAGRSLEESNRIMARTLLSPDFREGVRSYLEKRPPRFPAVAAGPGETPLTEGIGRQRP